jgi:hypothetical protein
MEHHIPFQKFLIRVSISRQYFISQLLASIYRQDFRVQDYRFQQVNYHPQHDQVQKNLKYYCFTSFLHFDCLEVHAINFH